MNKPELPKFAVNASRERQQYARLDKLECSRGMADSKTSGFDLMFVAIFATVAYSFWYVLQLFCDRLFR